MGFISSREQSQGHTMGFILIGTLRVDVILGLYQAGDVSRGHYMGFKPNWNIFLGTLRVAYAKVDFCGHHMGLIRSRVLFVGTLYGVYTR